MAAGLTFMGQATRQKLVQQLAEKSFLDFSEGNMLFLRYLTEQLKCAKENS